jgi:hypothetical protein
MLTKTVNYISHHAIAILALISSLLALAGASYAAIAIPKNSVGTKQLKRGAVTSTKLKHGAVTPAKLAAKQFGGYVRLYAVINGVGKLQYSRPAAKVMHWASTTQLTDAVVKWNKRIATSRCSVIVSPQQGFPPKAADGDFSSARGRAVVAAFEAGQGPFSITVVC